MHHVWLVVLLGSLGMLGLIGSWVRMHSKIWH